MRPLLKVVLAALSLTGAIPSAPVAAQSGASETNILLTEQPLRDSAEDRSSELSPLTRADIDRGIRQYARTRGVTANNIRTREPECFTVSGLNDEQARRFERRLRDVAESVGLEAGRPECRPNAAVLIVGNPAATFETIVDRKSNLLGTSDLRDVDLTTLRSELAQGRPAVGWTIGREFGRGPPGTPVPLGGVETWGNWSTGGNVGLNVPGSLSAASPFAINESGPFRAVLIIHAGELTGISLTQLADFSAMHLLGWPQREIEFEQSNSGRQIPTILSLFAHGPQSAPTELTSFDRAYLMGFNDSITPYRSYFRLKRRVTLAYAKLTSQASQQADGR